jgi:GNAT superfamily N-acetyltransferase
MNNFVIRPPTAADAAALLTFYRSFGADDAHYFQPWDATERAIAIHLANVALGRSASKIAVAPDGRIVGHAFIRYLWTLSTFRPRPVTGVIDRDAVVPLPAWWKRLLLTLTGKRFRPRLGIGLLPEVRGQGLGRELMQRVLDVARERGASEVRLVVHKTNIPGIALYHRVNFSIVGPFSQQQRGDSYEMIWRPVTSDSPFAAGARLVRHVAQSQSARTMSVPAACWYGVSALEKIVETSAFFL